MLWSQHIPAIIIIINNIPDNTFVLIMYVHSRVLLPRPVNHHRGAVLLHVL